MGSFAGSFVFDLGGDSSSSSSSGSSSSSSSITGGASGLSIEEMLSRHLPPMFRGAGWGSLLAAIAKGDEIVQQNQLAVYDQLFLSTASGIYLQRRAADVGYTKPAEVGMNDEAFRELVVGVTSEKLTENSILKILEVFYGPDSVRAYWQSGAPEPYSLTDGDKLEVSVDGSATVSVTFRSADFEQITAAKAIEVAEAINRQFRLNLIQGFAVPHLDIESGDYYTRIYSGARGLRGSLKIVGGTAQPSLLFPTEIAIDSIGKTWTITKTNNTLRFSANSDPGLGGLLAGDYVVIKGSEFSQQNRGSFPVTSVYLSSSSRYFEITNPSGSAEVVTQATSSSIRYFRPELASIQSGARTSTVTQTGTAALEIMIPATTIVVERSDGEAAYLHSTDLEVSSASRDASGVVTLTTSVPHGIAVGQWVHVDGLQSVATSGSSSGGLNGLYQVASTPTSQILTYSTPDFKQICTSVYSGGIVTVLKATQDQDVVGPYLYDPVGGLAITEKKSTTTSSINQGGRYHTIGVADATKFPDEPGYIALAIGHSYSAAPVPYFGRASATQLLIDFSYAFPESIPSGASVSFLATKTPFVPEPAGQDIDGSFYATGSASGRVACQTALEGAVAEGIDVTIGIIYPGDRGLGAEGAGATGQKLSDKVAVWGGDDIDQELETARGR